MVLTLAGSSKHGAHVVYQVFRFLKGIWLNLRNRVNQKRPILHHTCATCSKLPSYISTMSSFPSQFIQKNVKNNDDKNATYICCIIYLYSPPKDITEI